MEMNANRLERLADLLIKDANNPTGVKFNLRAWAKADGATVHESFKLDETTIKVDCGTQACAFGLAAISGEFAKDGLGWRILDQGLNGGMLQPTYQGEVEYQAAEDFFGLHSGEAAFLFDPWEYPDDKKTGAEAELEVVRRIKYLLNGNPYSSYGS